MPLIETAKAIASKKPIGKLEEPIAQPIAQPKEEKQVKKYSKMEEEPKEEPGEFPGDFFERYKTWMNNLSPEDRKKRVLEERRKVTEAE